MIHQPLIHFITGSSALQEAANNDLYWPILYNVFLLTMFPIHCKAVHCPIPNITFLWASLLLTPFHFFKFAETSVKQLGVPNPALSQFHI